MIGAGQKSQEPNTTSGLLAFAIFNSQVKKNTGSANLRDGLVSILITLNLTSR